VIIDTNICEIITIMCDILSIESTTCIKKSMCIVELSKKLRVGTLFNPIIFYIFYLIIFFKNI
jgi:hypothetical protein